MKYCIVGAGGTGGCIGSFLAKSGQDVTLIARGGHLEAIRENGLIVHSALAGDFTLKIEACTMEEYKDTPDVIFICVKYYSLDSCVDFINRTAGRDTLVIPVLNVFGTGGILQRSCPGCTVIDGCIYIFSMIETPGVISQPTKIFRIFFGFRDGQTEELLGKARQAEAELKSAGIYAEYTEQIEKEALRKFSYVSPIGAAGLYYNAKGGDFMVPGPQRELFFSLIREVEELGEAMGICFEEDLVDVNARILDGLTKDATTSMQRDVMSGRISEIDGLLNRVARLADTYGVILPCYTKISRWALEKSIK